MAVFGVSPSKLLLPLSYAAILGGTLTLVGTSTNLLASEDERAFETSGTVPRVGVPNRLGSRCRGHSE